MSDRAVSSSKEAQLAKDQPFLAACDVDAVLEATHQWEAAKEEKI